ncbi:MAG: 3-phosphoserine/phosphohydroxythreonine transaminase [Betaproteobacteria bacterium]|nr:3-phosphoserine/phosphohydroxythreonine transaminase [Betaproteobacteria bacterium]PWB63383.1 MAG: 3-phosphoserine/phosphohydroxythreonine transaminase [Betaproteobacteria bacterium]
MHIWNFGSGPAMLVPAVLEQAKAELLDWHGKGMSVMEMSHRGKEFVAIAAEAEADLRSLMGIPANYKVLFLQGGATAQFAAVPMNLLRGKATADFVLTGEWSRKALAEAKKYCRPNVAATAEDRNFTYVPKQASWKLSPDAAYVHVCTNETIGGVEYHWTPDTGDVPLVSDMSSHILSRPVDVSRYGLVFAGAQKNIGPAGLVIVIVREDLIGHALPDTPNILDFKLQADADSMLNTPPTFAVYLAGLTFKWLLAKGGLAAMERENVAKAKLLYECLDSIDFYSAPVAKEDRSRMNVPFRLKDDALDAKFLAEAEARGLSQLKGHRSVGGMRASIYNAMPLEGVEALAGFLRDFARRHG